MTDSLDDPDDAPAPEPVFEATILFSLLLEAGSAALATHEITEMEIADVVREMDEGAFVGIHKLIGVRHTPAGVLAGRLAQMGSDASFFPDTNVTGQMPDPGTGILVHQMVNGLTASDMYALFMRFVDEAGLQTAFLGWLEQVTSRIRAARDDLPERPGKA